MTNDWGMSTARFAAKTVMRQPQASLRLVSFAALALVILAAVAAGIYLLSERSKATGGIAEAT